MKDIYQNLKKHGRKILKSALVVGAGFIFNGCGEEIYRGNIDGKEVVYKEDKFSLIDPDNWLLNIMFITKGDTTFVFRDETNEIDIDWKNQNKPDFENEGLEGVAIKTPTETKKYFDFQTIYGDVDGEHTKIIFDKSNKMYNDFRKQIRIDVRSKYKTRLKSLERALN